MGRKMKKAKIWHLLGSLIFAACVMGVVVDSAAAMKDEELSYEVNGVLLKSYLAYDDAVAGKRPGVLVIHDWWGPGEFGRNRARALAKLGYTGLAVDMYGEGKEAANPEEASKLAGELRKNPSLMKARFDAARAALIKHPSVDPARIGAIGYSLGGYIILEMARQGSDLAGVASFWGSLKTDHPAQKGMVKSKVLVMTGTDDAGVPAEQVKKLKEEMDAAGVDYRVIEYPKAKHGFSRHDADLRAKKFNQPLAYNAEADQKSWGEMEAFFKQVFRR